MATFILEVYRPGLTARSSQAIVQLVIAAIGSADGAAPIRYLASTLAPDDEVCYLRLQSPTRDDVEALVRRLGLPDARIAEIIDLG